MGLRDANPATPLLVGIVVDLVECRGPFSTSIFQLRGGIVIRLAHNLSPSYIIVLVAVV